MTIRFAITRGDLLAINLGQLLRNRFIWTMVGLGSAFIIYSNLQAPAMRDQSLGMKITVSLISAVAVIAFLGALLVPLTVVRVLLAKNIGVLGEHRLTVGEEGLTEATEHNESLHRWSGYHRTVRTKRYLLLYVTDALVHVIPCRRPLLEGDLKAFEALVLEKSKGR